MGWSDYIRDVTQQRSYARKLHELNSQQIQQVRDSSTTKRILYANIPEPFDYVHNLYPEVNVRQAQVYHCNQYVLQQAGYAGVGGFYDIRSRLVFVTDSLDVNWDEDSVRAEFTLDEVLCHELIHYASNYKTRCSSRAIEEEIAYGKSINYLRKNGRSDDFIIRKNLFPYLLSAVDLEEIYRDVLLRRYDHKYLAEVSEDALKILLKGEKKIIRELHHKRAYEMGEKFIRLYGDARDAEIIESHDRELNVDDEL